VLSIYLALVIPALLGTLRLVEVPARLAVDEPERSSSLLTGFGGWQLHEAYFGG
jgi:hypothetical protein